MLVQNKMSIFHRKQLIISQLTISIKNFREKKAENVGSCGSAYTARLSIVTH